VEVGRHVANAGHALQGTLQGGLRCDVQDTRVRPPRDGTAAKEERQQAMPLERAAARAPRVRPGTHAERQERLDAAIAARAEAGCGCHPRTSCRATWRSRMVRPSTRRAPWADASRAAHSSRAPSSSSNGTTATSYASSAA